jgi:hypothetical protein
LSAQQRRFNVFREEFNHERPHEALDQETPAACYTPSPRPMPDRLPPLEYPDRFEVRYVSANGGIRWNRRWVNVSIVCVGEYVGLEEIDDGICKSDPVSLDTVSTMTTMTAAKEAGHARQAAEVDSSWW